MLSHAFFLSAYIQQKDKGKCFINLLTSSCITYTSSFSLVRHLNSNQNLTFYTLAYLTLELILFFSTLVLLYCI